MSSPLGEFLRDSCVQDLEPRLRDELDALDAVADAARGTLAFATAWGVEIPLDRLRAALDRLDAIRDSSEQEDR